MSNKKIVLFCFIAFSVAFHHIVYQPHGTPGWVFYIEGDHQPGFFAYEDIKLPELKENFNGYIEELCKTKNPIIGFCETVCPMRSKDGVCVDYAYKPANIDNVNGHIFISTSGRNTSHCMYKIFPELENYDCFHSSDYSDMVLFFHIEDIFSGRQCPSFETIIEKRGKEISKQESTHLQEIADEIYLDSYDWSRMKFGDRLPFFLVEVCAILELVFHNHRTNYLLVLCAFLTLLIPSYPVLILSVSFFFGHYFKHNHMFITIAIMFGLLLSYEPDYTFVFLFVPLFFYQNKKLSRDLSVILWFLTIYGSHIRETDAYWPNFWLCIVWISNYVLVNLKSE